MTLGWLKRKVVSKGMSMILPLHTSLGRLILEYCLVMVPHFKNIYKKIGESIEKPQN